MAAQPEIPIIPLHVPLHPGGPTGSGPRCAAGRDPSAAASRAGSPPGMTPCLSFPSCQAGGGRRGVETLGMERRELCWDLLQVPGPETCAGRVSVGTGARPRGSQSCTSLSSSPALLRACPCAVGTPKARSCPGHSPVRDLATHSCRPNPAQLFLALALPSWLLRGAVPIGETAAGTPHPILRSLPPPLPLPKLTGTGKGAWKKGIWHPPELFHVQASCQALGVWFPRLVGKAMGKI